MTRARTRSARPCDRRRGACPGKRANRRRWARPPCPVLRQRTRVSAAGLQATTDDRVVAVQARGHAFAAINFLAHVLANQFIDFLRRGRAQPRALGIRDQPVDDALRHHDRRLRLLFWSEYVDDHEDRRTQQQEMEQRLVQPPRRQLHGDPRGRTISRPVFRRPGCLPARPA